MMVHDGAWCHRAKNFQSMGRIYAIFRLKEHITIPISHQIQMDRQVESESDLQPRSSTGNFVDLMLSYEGLATCEGWARRATRLNEDPKSQRSFAQKISWSVTPKIWSAFEFFKCRVITKVKDPSGMRAEATLIMPELTAPLGISACGESQIETHLVFESIYYVGMNGLKPFNWISIVIILTCFEATEIILYKGFWSNMHTPSKRG